MKISKFQLYTSIFLNIMMVIYYACLVVYGRNTNIEFGMFVSGTIFLLVLNSIFLDLFIEQKTLENKEVIIITIIELLGLIGGYTFLVNTRAIIDSLF